MTAEVGIDYTYDWSDHGEEEEQAQREADVYDANPSEEEEDMRQMLVFAQEVVQADPQPTDEASSHIHEWSASSSVPFDFPLPNRVFERSELREDFEVPEEITSLRQVLTSVIPADLVEVTMVRYTNMAINIWKKKQTQAGKKTLLMGKECPAVTANEMWAMIGILIMKGVSHIRNMDDCWSSNPDLAHAGIKRTMPKHRYLQIWSFLRLTSPEDPGNHLRRGDNGYDPLFRVRPLYDAYRSTITTCWRVGGVVVADEMLLADKHHV
eukprot:1187578-Prorocentrum_minimum.AAC.2